RVPVLIGVATLEESGNQAVAFVLDLTARKRAEAEARQSEQRFREVQSALARANRVDTMGQLTASIAHEVRQPIAAAFTNAQAGLRWLGAQPPDIEEARQAFGRIVRDASRAGDIIGRIRTLVEKTPPRKTALAINEAILEVIALLHGEIVTAGVSARTELAKGHLPRVQGDRVQLKQVIFNLIVNAIEAMRQAHPTPRHLLVPLAPPPPRRLP